jgi:Tfp pilus assembly protein PilN
MRLLDRSPFAPWRDRRCGLALLGDLEAAARQRVQLRGLAVGACVLAQAGGVAGDQPVAVELDQAVGDAAGCSTG